jgi:hypothetical protein
VSKKSQEISSICRKEAEMPHDDDISRKTNQSEVARLMAQIDVQMQAAQRGVHGFAEGAAYHKFMTKRAENIANIVAELREKVGEEVAMQALIACQDAAATTPASGSPAP